MPSRVGVIIPTLNAEGTIGAAIDSAWRAGADEVWVSDGGSSDRTRDLASPSGARVLSVAGIRGEQSNAAARECKCEILIFLHGDTTLPDGACSEVRRALESGYSFGGFDLRFRERSLALAIAEKMINLRTRLTRCPWGDQAQFVRRELFLAMNGFRSIPIMEDYDLAVRMKRKGRTAIIDGPVITSGVRFVRKGLLLTAAINWLLVAAYRAGVPPEKLAKIYRR